jgi:citrate synthase
MQTQSLTRANPGLEGVVAAETRLSLVDGERGELIVAGLELEELAQHDFESVVALLWEAAGVATPARVAAEPLPSATLALLRAAAQRRADPMDALRMATATLAAPDDFAAARLLVGSFPTIVAAYARLMRGEEPIAPRADLELAANYLYMLRGQEPHAELVRGLDAYLTTVADHGLNASTFTARVIASTAADFVSADTGAIGALKGPLHGGAPGPALDMVFEIGDAARAESVLRAKLARGERLQTNVEFYTALLLHGLGLETAFFTPTFAIGRVAGWTAHCFEQRALGRLIRPQSLYVGRLPS